MMYRQFLVLALTGCVLLPCGSSLNSLARAAEPKDEEKPFDFVEASRDVPKPREVYPYVKRDMIPMDLKIISDELVTSDTDPSKKLRKITAHFNSLELEDRIWGHPCVIFMPADNSINLSPDRKGKVVIVGSPGWAMFPAHVEKYGEPMTIEMIPNYRHYNFHEIQFIDLLMWVAHVFDGRPISEITEIHHEYRDGRNYYRAKVESGAKIQLVRTWFVYAHNPEWRDLMWFEWIMNKEGDYYETSVPGRKADAYMIEVADTAIGFPGYVTSLPMKLTDTPVKDREARKAGWMGPPETNK